jgi:membrane protein implicated in regulation of membrane protease activity
MEILYFCIGIIGLVMALGSFVFGEFLHTDHLDGAAGWLGDHLPFFDADHHFEFSKFLNTGAFLGALSGFGFVAAFVMAQFDKSALEAAGWGALGGIALGGMIGLFWVLLRRSEGTVGYDVNSLVGLDATVEDRIYRNGVGKVKCSVHGTSVWHTARSMDGSEVEKGTTVRVEKVVGNTLYVVSK